MPLAGAESSVVAWLSTYQRVRIRLTVLGISMVDLGRLHGAEVPVRHILGRADPNTRRMAKHKRASARYIAWFADALCCPYESLCPGGDPVPLLYPPGVE